MRGEHTRKMEKEVQKNKLEKLLEQKGNGLLSVYFTAGYPSVDDTIDIARQLEHSGADLIEIGMPYSDPVADGPTIQESNQKALQNGMTVARLMEQLDSSEQLGLPIILMGYFNPILQYGVERFCADCQKSGISALIIPDLPVEEYLKNYQHIFEQYELHNIFLITPQTDEQRIRWIDENSESFIYAVADASITGAKQGISDSQEVYFKKLVAMNLKHPFLIGFGISNHQTFSRACKYGRGAIIGSAFINVLRESDNLAASISQFVRSIKSEP